jgi:hypothetical protein
MDTPAERPEAPARRRIPLVPALVAALVVAVSLAAAFAAMWLTNEGDDGATAREIGSYLATRIPQVEDRAAEIATLLLNYDSTNIEEVSQEILALATGDFRHDYEDIVGGGNLQKALEESASSSRGQILDGPDVYFRSPSEAIALVEVSQTAQSQSNPAGSNIDYVMKLTLVATPEGWKADGVDVISQQRT